MRQPFKVRVFNYFYEMELYDKHGREVFTLDDAIQAANDYHPDWTEVYNGESGISRDELEIFENSG